MDTYEIWELIDKELSPALDRIWDKLTPEERKEAHDLIHEYITSWWC